MDRDEGEIYFQGERVFNKSEKLVPGTPGVAIVHQDFQLEPGFTVFDIIRHHLNKYTREYQIQRTKELIEICNLSELQNKQAKELSGGQKQKVALAKALIEEPPLLILDEPFSNLDNISKADFKEILRKVVDELNISLLFVTHDSKDAITFSDEIIIVQNGNVLQQGEPKNLVSKPTNSYAARLLGLSNIILGKDIQQFFDESLIPDKHYWVPFGAITIEEGNQFEATSTEFLGDEIIMNIRLSESILKIKSFEPFVQGKFSITITKAVLLD